MRSDLLAVLTGTLALTLGAVYAFMNGPVWAGAGLTYMAVGSWHGLGLAAALAAKRNANTAMVMVVWLPHVVMWAPWQLVYVYRALKQVK